VIFHVSGTLFGKVGIVTEIRAISMLIGRILR
jgi:hypothetical protein